MLHAAPVSREDEVEVRRLLGVDPGLFKRPLPERRSKEGEIGKSVSAGTADQIVKSIATGKGKPAVNSAVLMAWNPVAGRTPPTLSVELKSYLSKRSDRKPHAVPVIIVIRHGNGQTRNPQAVMPRPRRVAHPPRPCCFWLCRFRSVFRLNWLDLPFLECSSNPFVTSANPSIASLSKPRLIIVAFCRNWPSRRCAMRFLRYALPVFVLAWRRRARPPRPGCSSPKTRSSRRWRWSTTRSPSPSTIRWPITTVEQTFRNHTDRNLEATYLFPVPKGASVDKFTMWVDGKETGRRTARRQARPTRSTPTSSAARRTPACSNTSATT